MRRTWPLAVALALFLSAGCGLHKSSNDCVANPGLTSGSPTVCTQPPPAQFSQLGQ
ncbi:hypothetical protein ACVW00_000614 [Marmoricola sp. URHA0025 HA25]